VQREWVEDTANTTLADAAAVLSAVAPEARDQRQARQPPYGPVRRIPACRGGDRNADTEEAVPAT